VASTNTVSEFGQIVGGKRKRAPNRSKEVIAEEKRLKELKKVIEGTK
jgi:hypothetical protein